MEILITFPDSFDRASFSAVAGHRYHFLDAGVTHWRPTLDFDILAYVDRCLRYARANRIDAVASVHDLGDLVAAIVAAELGLPGPSVESVFLCLHKYYGRQCEPDPIRCRYFHLSEDPRPEVPGYPCYLKPPWLKLSLFGFRIDSEADFDRALGIVRRDYPAWARQYLPIFREHIDLARYPLAGEDIFLIEELVEGPQVTVEGWADARGVHVWAITDTNAHPGNARMFDSFSYPSRHPPHTQALLAKRAAEMAARVGFRQGFFNAEFWCLGDRVRLIEMNGRAAACFDGLYRRCLGASVFEAVSTLACGRPLEAPPAPTGVVGGQFNFVTSTEGRAAALLDFEAARAVPMFDPFLGEDAPVRQVSDAGVVLGQIELFGSSHHEIEQEADRLRRLLLK